jgi:RIO-like serine/threonine protein kinase
MAESELLKKDLCGEIRQANADGEARIVRDASSASPWLAWLARFLLRREARVLAALTDVGGIPQLLAIEHKLLARSYLSGDPAYFAAAARLLSKLHRIGVVHNDLAKEPNFLVLDSGDPALLDFQLAWFSPRRGRLFRLLAYEDLRHLLKHKRSYCPQRLTRRELGILANPSIPSRLWMRTVKPVYLFITRRILGWEDREGAADRGDQQ